MKYEMENPNRPRWVMDWSNTRSDDVVPILLLGFGLFGNMIACVVSAAVCGLIGALTPLSQSYMFGVDGPSWRVFVVPALYWITAATSIILGVTKYKPLKFDSKQLRDAHREYYAGSPEKRNALHSALLALQEAGRSGHGFNLAYRVFNDTVREFDELERERRALTPNVYMEDATQALQLLRQERNSIRELREKS